MLKTVLFFLAFAFSLIACTSAPAQVANIVSNPPETAYNVTVKTNRIEASFKDACFVVYLDGCGATALFDGRQNDFDCLVSETQAGEFTAVNAETGDYVVLNVETGVVTSKVAGVFGIFLPTVEGMAGVSKM